MLNVNLIVRFRLIQIRFLKHCNFLCAQCFIIEVKLILMMKTIL